MVHSAKLLIASLVLTAFQPALAQGLDAGSMQSMNPSSAIGPEQDSLLPPEVTPYDPRMMSQAPQANGVSPAAAQANNAPGLSTAPAMSARDMRSQALGQLMGDQNTIPPAAMKPWRAGQSQAPSQVPGFAPMQAHAGGTPGMVPGQMSSSMPPISGMPNGTMPGYGSAPMPQGYGSAPQGYGSPALQPGAPNYQMANNPTTSISQSQTLTGGSQNQPVSQNTRRGGFSNMFSSGATTGLGVLFNPMMSGLMMAGPFTRF